MPDPQQTIGFGGKPSEATMDQVNIWMRSTDWYQAKMREWGQDPGHPHISKDQGKELLKLAQAQGVVVNEGEMEVDKGGNFDTKGHNLRNTLIVAGIAAATIATMGAAGVFSGAAAGGGATAGGAGGAAGLLPSTTLAGSSVLGGSGLTSAGIAGGTGLGAGGTSALLAGGAIPTGSALAGGGLAAGPGLGTVGKLLSTGKDIGTAISNASSGAGNTRRADYDTNVGSQRANIEGQSAYETELLNRAKLEADQRKSAEKDIYRQGYFANPPSSPYNPRPTNTASPAYQASLADLSQQALKRLKMDPQYGTDTMTPLPPYVPMKPTQQGGLEQAGSWIGPAVSLGSSLWKAFR